MDQMQLVSVGQKCKFPATIKNDTIKFVPNNSGHYEVHLYLKGVKDAEVKALNGRLTFGLTEIQNLFFVTMKLEDIGITMDMPFDAKNFVDAVNVPQYSQGIHVMVILVDITSSVCRAISDVILNHEFSVELYRTIMVQNNRTLDSQKYLTEIERVYQRFSSEQIAALSKVKCTVQALQREQKEQPEQKQKFAGISPTSYRKDNYPNLPVELREYNYWVDGIGSVIMAIPEVVLSSRPEDDLDMLEVTVPVQYVLDTGYSIYEGHVLVKGEYDPFEGFMVPSKY